MLAQISAPHFTAGIVLVDDIVKEAAPIVKYMRNWSRASVRNYCDQKGWKISIVRQVKGTDMKIWFDTEFYENGETIKLISIGMVREDGATYYAETADAERHASASPWLMENVLPHLGGPRIATQQIGKEIVSFAREKPEFWAYYADYDWVALCQLFGTMMQLPKGWPMYCRDVKQLCDSFGNPDLPKQESGEHNALADALWTRDAWRFLMDRERSRRIKSGELLPPGVHCA